MLDNNFVTDKELRNIYNLLRVKSRYRGWVQRSLEKVQAAPNVDYVRELVPARPGGQVTYRVTFDTLRRITRTAKGVTSAIIQEAEDIIQRYGGQPQPVSTPPQQLELPGVTSPAQPTTATGMPVYLQTPGSSAQRLGTLAAPPTTQSRDGMEITNFTVIPETPPPPPPSPTYGRREWRVFNHEYFGTLHVLWDPHGEPHFIGVEVARALGYQNPSSALYQLLGGGLSKSDMPTPSGAQNCTIITFNQLLLLVSRSTLPAARKFQEWVRDEVLASLFRLGHYQLPLTPTVPQTFGEALMLAANLQLRIEQQEGQLARQTFELEQREQQLRAQAPAVALMERVAASPLLPDVFLFRDLVRLHGMPGPIRMYAALREDKVLFRPERSRGYKGHQIYQRYVDAGLLELRLHKVDRTDGTTTTSMTPFVVGCKGWEWFWSHWGAGGDMNRWGHSSAVSPWYAGKKVGITPFTPALPQIPAYPEGGVLGVQK